MKVTVTIATNHKSYDFSVDQEQIIMDTLRVFQQNLQIFPPNFEKLSHITLSPYQRRIPVTASFLDAGIYTGSLITVACPQ